MLLEQRTYKTKAGEVRQSPTWSVRFVDHTGVNRRLALFKSKTASQAFVQRLRRLLEAKAGGEPLDRDMLTWIGKLGRALLERLISFGLIDAKRISSTIPLSEHLDAWERSVRNEGRTRAHVVTTVGRARKVFAGAGATRWSEIDARVVAEWLAARTGPKGWSVRTHNSYVQSAQQFTRWMVTHENALLDPLVSLKTRSTGTGERRRERRALTVEESRRLIAAAESDTVDVAGVSPKTRGLLYRMALMTGLRYGELCDLQVGWVHFGKTTEDPKTGALVYASKPTTITPPAGATKAGRKSGRIDTVVVPMELHLRLREAAAGKHPRALLLDRLRPQKRSTKQVPRAKGAELIKHDLVRAGIRYIDEAGKVVDFHALRHTALTVFASLGTSLGDMLKFSRHSDPNTTKGYLHAEMESRAALAARMPTLDIEPDQRTSRSAVGSESRGTFTGPPLRSDHPSGDVTGGKMMPNCGVDGVSAEICNPSPYHLAMPPPKAGSVAGSPRGATPTREEVDGDVRLATARHPGLRRSPRRRCSCSRLACRSRRP